MSRYIAAIDQGTTSTHCMLSDRRGEVAAARQLQYQQILPRQVWVEHYPIELWHRTQEVVVGVRYSVCGSRWCGIVVRAVPIITPSFGRIRARMRWAKTGVQDRFRTQTCLPLTNCVSTG